MTQDFLDIDEIADKVASKLITKLNLPNDTGTNTTKQTLSLTEARKVLFHGKSREWIKYYLIGKYPEITAPGGWMTAPSGTGHRIKVLDVDRAKKWLADHATKIDWDSPEPITLKRRMGLAKPIKRN